MSPTAFGVGSSRAFGIANKKGLAVPVVKEFVQGTEITTVAITNTVVKSGYNSSIFFDPSVSIFQTPAGLPITFSSTSYNLTTRSGDRTVEMWFYPTDTAISQATVLSLMNDLSDTSNIRWHGSPHSTSSSTPTAFHKSNSSTVGVTGSAFGSTNYVNSNQWNHLVSLYSNDQFLMLLNGSSAGFSFSLANYANAIPSTFGQYIRLGSPTNPSSFRGYIAEVRISNVIRWPMNTTTYTVPSSPYSVDANTVALIRSLM